jgi:hypothetical protein
MIVGLKESETAETVLSAISSSLYDYELELNGEKTAIHGEGLSHSPEWRNFIKRFSVSSTFDGQRDDIDSFFEETFHLADKDPRDNVIRYAVRRSTSFHIHPRNWNHFIRCLLYATRRGPSSLEITVEYTASVHKKGKTLPIDEIPRFIEENIGSKAEAAQTYEVCWLLFWARELGIRCLLMRSAR